MAYSDQINYLKEALNGYSAEEEKLSALYKTAIENAEKAHAASMKQLEAQYQDDRNEVYADNARDERNLYNVLAQRGLGFSGEAAQAKLNSNLALSNRLGDITKEKNASALQLDLDLAANKSNLSMEEAEKFRNILDSKNQLNADIAEMELQRETDEAKLKAENANAAAKLQAEKESEAAKLQAEKEALAAKLQAEKDMQAAELQAKYNYTTSNNSSGSGGTANEEQGEEAEIDSESGYVPSANASTLAKQIINTATSGGDSVSKEEQEYIVNKYLIELLENYNIDKDYYNDLVFLLKSYGYSESTLPEMRIQVISHDAKSYYGSTYDTVYDRCIVVGYSEGQARKKAVSVAQNQQLEYIYSRCDSVIEFKECCQKVGLGESKAEEYLASSKGTVTTQTSGSGSMNGYVTRGDK